MRISNYHTLYSCAELLVEKYTSKKGKKCIITSTEECPLCRVYKIRGSTSCTICPLRILKRSCYNFSTFDNINKCEPKTWKARKEFWIKVLNHLEHTNPRNYMPSKVSKKTFQFMLDIEKELVEKYKL